MSLVLSWILCFLFDFSVFADGGPVGQNPQSLHIVPFIAMKSDGSSVCEDKEAFRWTYGFHDCFISRKYTDGGRDLNSIVDRILDHGEACIETTSEECRPDFRGFITLMNKTISQMKDYAQMYLEEIHKGRENIKDLECIETSLNIKTFEDCFHDIVPTGFNMSEENFQTIVQEGIFCANRANSGCSKEAKTSLNRIVRIILGVEQPNEEEFEVEIKSTEAPSTKVEQPNEDEFISPETPATKVEQPIEDEFISPETPATKVEQPIENQFIPPEDPATKGEQPNEEFMPIKDPATIEQRPNENEFYEEITPTEAPAPWMWYDYLAYPFIQAWKWFSGLF